MTLNSIFDFAPPYIKIPENDFDILLILLGIAYLSLIGMRLLKILKKRTCPSCSGKLNRRSRNMFDKVIVVLVLNILPFRRYKCIHCGWEGLRWSNRKYKVKDNY